MKNKPLWAVLPVALEEEAASSCMSANLDQETPALQPVPNLDGGVGHMSLRVTSLTS